ncbi:sugar ABC transporter ATP-binding protein [Mariluticola halotolerans]|uniref:sugar ABC transporter ATP-binding protein n=1 Tax=Mariluticola halotolerans TaxID=2909283 RepID=UPI0026E4400A|nr:sugar ABC transporter ATP-binding protein [Mariluticola halotolerans]UJQ94209.1 sugar ABC transporter ATP-binding protein [Mariluticola halotolerans]
MATQNQSKTSGALVAPVVSLDGASKSFGPVHALIEASLTIRPGECVGLVGHNGAGKSTLVNVINGRLAPTGGAVNYAHQMDTQKNLRNDARARLAGIRSVFQELSLCPNLTVLENLRIPYKTMPLRSWRKNAATQVMAALDMVFPNHGIDARTIVGDLSIAERQMVEIAIAFSDREAEANLVILDEPTSSLDASIAHQLLTHIKKFCAEGGAVIFITHMLGEIFEVATRIVVMKDGRIVENRPAGEFTRDLLVGAMGHVVPASQTTRAANGEHVFGEEIVRLPSGLAARKGEIIGLAGLAGHGQAEALAEFYLQKTSEWRGAKHPAVAFVAGDRARDGVMPLWSIMKNLSLATLAEFGKNGLIDFARERRIARDWKEKIQIKSDDLTNPILSLSGGNQQKVLFAKALASSAPIIVMDDPMRGVDVGTKREVYKMIRDEAQNGRTFLWYSTETDEVHECDRVFVFRDGMISAELSGDAITEENILRASFEMQEATQ